MSAPFRMTAAHFEAREQKLRATTAENELAEALALITDLHAQLDLANAAAVRLARRPVGVEQEARG